MHDIIDAFVYTAMEVASATVVIGAFFLHAMPAFATILAVVWYLICIINSAPVKRALERRRAKHE